MTTTERAALIVGLRELAKLIGGRIVGKAADMLEADAPFQPGSSTELNAIHAVIMGIGGDWPEVEGDPYTLYHVKRMARELAAFYRAGAQPPVAFLPAVELGRLNSGHSANVRSAKFGPSQLDGDVPLYLKG